MDKPIIFISHISEEREIASSLKALVEDGFLGIVDVFVSSDPESIQLGQQWLDKISKSLKNCVVEIVVASPLAVRRQWVNFEAGAGWVRGIPVIPICHSGITPGTLPAPLNTLQAATATNEKQLSDVCQIISKELGIRTPSIDFTQFISVVQEYERKTTTNGKLAAEDGQQALPLPKLEFDLLKAVAKGSSSSEEAVDCGVLESNMRKMGYNRTDFLAATKSLERKLLIRKELNYTDPFGNHHPSGLAITAEGWEVISSNLAEFRS